MRDVMLLFPVFFSDVVIALRVTDQVTVVIGVIHSFIKNSLERTPRIIKRVLKRKSSLNT